MAFYVTHAAGFASSCIFIKIMLPIEKLHINTHWIAERWLGLSISSLLLWFHGVHSHDRPGCNLEGGRSPVVISERTLGEGLQRVPRIVRRTPVTQTVVATHGKIPIAHSITTFDTARLHYLHNIDRPGQITYYNVRADKTIGQIKLLLQF